MELSPHAMMLRMISGYWITQAIYVAAKLGVADALAAGPKPVDGLAAEVGAHEPSLRRLLRSLSSVGVFAERDDGRFELTPLAQCLRSDDPGSQRGLAIMNGEEHYFAYGELLYSVQTGKPGFDRHYGQPVFEYLQAHPEQGAIFDAAMSGVHGRETGAMLDVYDFSQVKWLVDVGGGNGGTLCATLERWPQMRGTLYDLPAVVERATPRIAARGLADRCTAVGGDFFQSAPEGADGYLLRHIIHDWDDERSLTILRNVRRAMRSAEARLLVVENVIDPGNAPGFGKLLDLTMLVIPGGVERTAAEFHELFAASGFELTAIHATSADVSILVGEPR